MRKIFLFFLLLIYTMPLKAQEMYTVNEHGLYVIDSGIITKVPFRLPTNGNISIFGFWRDCAVFLYGDDEYLGIVIFNIENGAVNDIMDESFFAIPEIIESDNHLRIMLGKWNNDFSVRRFDVELELDYYIYTFEIESLELLEETYVGKFSSSRTYLPVGENITYNKTNDNTVRYSHEEIYFDVIYGPEVNMCQWDRFFVYYDSNLNRYAIFVNEYYDGK